MSNTIKELAKVHYTATAIKVLHFNYQAQSSCFRIHWHDRMELLYIRQGEMILDYGTTTLTAHAGSLVIIPPKMSHKGYTKTQEVDYDVLMFDVRSFYNNTEICKNLLPTLYDGRAKLKPITLDMFTIQCFQEICNCHHKESLEITHKIYLLLFLLLENNLLQLQERQKSTTVQEIVNYLEQNFNQDMNSALLSNQFGYSITHLYRMFKEAIGLSPIQYLNIYRLERAFERIKHTALSIGEIAVECGFSDANYFARSFKKHFGFPPTYYRKNTK